MRICQKRALKSTLHCGTRGWGGWDDKKSMSVTQFDPMPQSLVEAPVTFGQRIDFIRGFLHRRHLGILICMAIALPVGAFYAFTSPKTYTASATMMIETRKGPLDSQTNAVPLDVAWFETQ